MHGTVNIIVNWLEAKVKERVENYTRRRITEAVLIQSLPSTSNLDNGLELNPTFWVLFSLFCNLLKLCKLAVVMRSVLV